MAVELWGHGSTRDQVRSEAYREAYDLILRLSGSAEYREAKALRTVWEALVDAAEIGGVRFR